MKRTPQANLTQSKLTAMFQTQHKPATVDPEPGAAGAAPTVEQMDTEMATAPLPAAAKVVKESPPVTADFLLKSLKENTDMIIKSFSLNLDALSKIVEGNATNIAANSEAIARNSKETASQCARIDALEQRMHRMEGGGPQQHVATHTRATLSRDYLDARRSLRLWPVLGGTQDELWDGTLQFVREVLEITEQEVNEVDIESITRVCDNLVLQDRQEVLVKFNDSRKRDTVMSSSVKLAARIDAEGKPTAGIRLEIPGELSDTFRLLSRFGTRLRARHGIGTKRHIKFDDFCGSLYSNIKLPGDEHWTKITPQMAREDLDASHREESEYTRKRLATKLVPGPKERLQRPLPIQPREVRLPLLGSQDARTLPTSGPSGKRPRVVPARGPTL